MILLGLYYSMLSMWFVMLSLLCLGYGFSNNSRNFSEELNSLFKDLESNNLAKVIFQNIAGISLIIFLVEKLNYISSHLPNSYLCIYIVLLSLMQVILIASTWFVITVVGGSLGIGLGKNDTPMKISLFFIFIFIFTLGFLMYSVILDL